MSGILDSKGNHRGKSPKREVMDNILFRWIILMIIAMAAKVLNKDEVMNIYVLIGKEAGHSPVVDGFHTELLRLMKHGEDGEKND